MAARNRGARSWVWNLGILGVVAVPGFVLGLVAGVAWEEPSLLGRHLLGGTTEVVAWSPQPAAETPVAEAPRELPPVAAPPPAEPVAVSPPARTPPPAPKPADATRLRPEVLAPGAPGGRFVVQVGAFSEAAGAEALATRLRARGFEVTISPGVAAGQPRWRVRVGPSPTRDEAEKAAARLKREEQLPTWVLDENAPV